MKKSVTALSDGRELVFYDSRDDLVRDVPDRRVIRRPDTRTEVRDNPLLDECVIIASHRGGRTYRPPNGQCPLCPARPDWQGEIPDVDYEVVAFENRFPSLVGAGPESDAPLAGRCEVISYSADHHASLVDLSEERVALILDVWIDRTAELHGMPGIEQVFLFEDRGEEVGMSIAHPHGQIYAYPFVPPRMRRTLETARQHRALTGRNIFDDVLAAALGSDRVVIRGEHWTAFVPSAPRWPYEVHLYPHQRVPHLTELDDATRAEFPALYLDLLNRFECLFDRSGPVPYLSSWLQAPSRGGSEFALHLEIFTVRRSSEKLKHLAGSELLMDVFVNEVAPESAAATLRSCVR